MLERRTNLLQQWLHIEQARPTVSYRKVEIRLQKGRPHAG
jgi:hypothetical protein